MSERLPVLLIPGLAASPAAFSGQQDALWERGALLFGDTGVGDSVEAIASEILRTAPDRFALGGFSMGGYIALAMLRLAPERVARLALIDTQARADSEDAKAKRLEAIARTENGEFVAVINGNFANAVHPDHVDDAALKAANLEMAEATGQERYIRHQKAIMARPDARGQLSSIACPVLVLVGVGDRITPVEVAREMADAIPDARLEVITKAGHLGLMEQKHAYRRLLVDWARA